MREVLRAPAVTVNVGAALPMFILYEYPGPWAGVTLGWRLSEHTQVIATADVAVFMADGARRYSGSLGGGVRVWPWRRRPLWLQVGLGTTGYVERIGVVLPERMVSATDVGGLLTVAPAIGVRVARWQVGLRWDHIVWPLPYYEHYTGSETLPYRGTAMVWLGRSL